MCCHTNDLLVSKASIPFQPKSKTRRHVFLTMVVIAIDTRASPKDLYCSEVGYHQFTVDVDVSKQSQKLLGSGAANVPFG